MRKLKLMWWRKSEESPWPVIRLNKTKTPCWIFNYTQHGVSCYPSIWDPCPVRFWGLFIQIFLLNYSLSWEKWTTRARIPWKINVNPKIKSRVMMADSGLKTMKIPPSRISRDRIIPKTFLPPVMFNWE